MGCKAETIEQKGRALILLQIQKDLFITEVMDLPQTDLVVYRIPTDPAYRPKPTRTPLFNPKEVEWQKKHLPVLEKNGIIKRCNSPFITKTRHLRKVNSILRIVHVFYTVNDATIKLYYPLRRMEPLINDIGRKGGKVKF